MSLTSSRNGGDLVAESLTALGTKVVFGVPGQHALGLFDALRRSGIEVRPSRTEYSAAFAADGFARATGKPGIVLVSTGPGALFTLPALQESLSSSVPVICVSSQIPSAGLGARRQGYLHELEDQADAFRRIAKTCIQVRAHSQISAAFADAWSIALTPPHGPVYIEIPQDVLIGSHLLPTVEELEVQSELPLAPQSLLDTTARSLDEARSPVIIAGGGVVKSGSSAELRELAERLQAPVVTTFGGTGAFPWTHPLSLQSWLEDRFMTELLEDSDLVLVVGSGLGELSTNYRTFAPKGRLIQIDADAGVLNANYDGIGIRSDAKSALVGILSQLRSNRDTDHAVHERVRKTLDAIQHRLSAQDLSKEIGLIESIRRALPVESHVFWDMTIIGYWAWSAWDAASPGLSHSAQGSGGLGYAFPAALGAAAVSKEPVLAVSGDGGAMYGLAELATAKQHEANVTWLIVDDGGYGILREYMNDAFGQSFATELKRPDFVRLAESFGVRGTTATIENISEVLSRELAEPGPSVVVIEELLRMFAPTHSGQ